MSASGTLEFGGIGTWPHTPTPPFFTLSTSIASAFGSLRYLLATSLYDGPTIFLSTSWHAVQAFFFASSRLANAGEALTAMASAAATAVNFMKATPWIGIGLARQGAFSA